MSSYVMFPYLLNFDIVLRDLNNGSCMGPVLAEISPQLAVRAHKTLRVTYPYLPSKAGSFTSVWYLLRC
jgi:hypothetical protein